MECTEDHSITQLVPILQQIASSLDKMDNALKSILENKTKHTTGYWIPDSRTNWCSLVNALDGSLCSHGSDRYTNDANCITHAHWRLLWRI